MTAASYKARRYRLIAYGRWQPSAGEEHQPQIEQAKEICRRCPVRAECLEYALMLPIRHGIFGGLDEVERDLLRRRQSRRAA